MMSNTALLVMSTFCRGKHIKEMIKSKFNPTLHLTNTLPYYGSTNLKLLNPPEMCHEIVKIQTYQSLMSHEASTKINGNNEKTININQFYNFTLMSQFFLLED